MSNTDYLGTAIQNPLNLINGRVATSRGVEVVRKSMIDLFETSLNDTFFLEERGSRLRDLIFEPNTEVFEDLARVFIYEAVEKWERRTAIQSIEFKHSNEVVEMRINHRILSSNEIDSFVYPFYKSLKY